jgi:hypothetical protein
MPSSTSKSEGLLTPRYGSDIFQSPYFSKVQCITQATDILNDMAQDRPQAAPKKKEKQQLKREAFIQRRLPLNLDDWSFGLNIFRARIFSLTILKVPCPARETQSKRANRGWS